MKKWSHAEFYGGKEFWVTDARIGNLLNMADLEKAPTKAAQTLLFATEAIRASVIGLGPTQEEFDKYGVEKALADYEVKRKLFEHYVTRLPFSFILEIKEEFEKVNKDVLEKQGAKNPLASSGAMP